MKENLMTYSEAKNYIQEHLPQIRTVTDWFKYSESPDFYKKLPKDPRSFYSQKEENSWPKKDGWEEFLGLVNEKKIGILSYSAAVEVVRDFKIKNLDEYRNILSLFNVKNLPYSPHDFYKKFNEDEFYGR